MSEADDELDRIRKQKREELVEQATTPETPDEPIDVSGGELSGLVEEHDVVLVDFYADWCGPCKQLAPIVESVAERTDAAVAKVDIDANQQLAAEYSVRSVPTLVLFADGDLVEQLVGVQQEGRLVELIERYGSESS